MTSDILTVDQIVSNEEKCIAVITRTFPADVQTIMQQHVRESIAALKADDPKAAADAISKIRATGASAQPAPQPGQVIPLLALGSKWADCGGDDTGTGSITGAAVYAVKYWSCVLAS